MSETAKHRHLVAHLCQGNGVDLGSSGCPVVPWAIQIELPDAEFRWYNDDRDDHGIQWRGDACDLPFKDATLDFLHSSHLLEDFEDWTPILREWDRCLKPGGYMLIAVPDHERFRAAVARNLANGIESDNLNHKHESCVGELSEYLQPLGYETIRDDFVPEGPDEYSILYIGSKPQDNADADWSL